MEKISKEEAKEKGLNLYFTGRPCRRGGVAPRRVSNGQCTCDNCKLIKSKADKKYSQLEEAKARRRVASKKYYKNNKDLHAKRVADWKERNKEFWKWYSKYYREVNKEQCRYSYEKYYEENKHEYSRRCKEYREALKTVTPKWYDTKEASEIYKLAGTLRDATGEAWDVDHIIPIKAKRVCGLHWHGNLQVIPATLNRSKGNKLKYMGYLEWLSDYDRTLYSPVSFGLARDGRQN